MDERRDRLTDYSAALISIVVALSAWAMLVYEWYSSGAPPTWLLAVGVLLVILAVLTLFGTEKVRAAVEIIRENK